MVIIKDELKRHGVTLSEVSQKIGVSRPTLDKYIQQYESNTKIQNESLQVLFDSLFSQTLSTDEFLDLMNTYNVESPKLTANPKKCVLYEYFLSYSHDSGIDRCSVTLTEQIDSMAVISNIEDYITTTHGLINVRVISFNLLNREIMPNHLIRDFKLLDSSN